jgi:hypothetical protein
LSASASFPVTIEEELVTSPAGFGLGFDPASPEESTISDLQLGLCRILEGLPLASLAHSEKLAEALNLSVEDLAPYEHNPVPRSKEVIVLAAVRTAKSLIAAAVAIWATQNVEIPVWIKEGEVPRYSIASLELDNARVILGHLAGALSKPALSSLRVPKKSEPLLIETGAEAVGSFFVYNPQGRIVEIRIVAGKKAGGSLVSRWSIGCTFDEAPRMAGESDAVINYSDSLKAIRSRLLEGAQVLAIGSPWQPYGPIYDRVQDFHGDLLNKARVVFRAKGPDMNPVWWNEERCAELRDSPSRDDQITYQTDVLARFADEAEAMFSEELLRRQTMKGISEIMYEARRSYCAAMDPATRTNAWTLVIGSRYGNILKEVLRVDWKPKPNEPLNPRFVLQEVKEHLDAYGLNFVYTDQWAADHNKQMAYEEGFACIDIAWTQAEITKSYGNLQIGLEMGLVEILDEKTGHKDLKLVKKKPKSGGGYRIELPETSDGRHCDFAPPMARVFSQWIADILPEQPKPGTPGYADYYEKKLEQQDLDRFEREQMTVEDEEFLGISREMLEDPWEGFMRQRNLITIARELAEE